MRIDAPNLIIDSSTKIQPLVLVADTTASAVATVDLSLPANFDYFLVRFWNVVPATDGVTFQLQSSSDGGATFDAGASDYVWTMHVVDSGATAAIRPDTADTRLALTSATAAELVGNAAPEGLSGQIFVHSTNRANDPNRRFFIHGRVAYLNQSTALFQANTSGRRATIGYAATHIRLAFSSGNIASGRFQVYGFKQ